MLHTMQVRVVTRQSKLLPYPVVHKAYYFCPSMISIRAGDNIEEYITKAIEEDIEKFKKDFVEFTNATFVILPEHHAPSLYIW